MYKIAAIVMSVYICILLIIFGVQSSYGPELEYETLNMFKFSNLEDDKATCMAYHGEVISNVEIYSEFLETCEITATFDYDEDYFSNDVFVVYYYNGGAQKVPKSFHDYYWSMDNSEIIKVKSEWSLRHTDDDAFNLYFIEMAKNDILSADVIFD